MSEVNVELSFDLWEKCVNHPEIITIILKLKLYIKKKHKYLNYILIYLMIHK